MKFILLIFSTYLAVQILAVKNNDNWPQFYYYPSLDKDPVVLNVTDRLGGSFPKDKQTVFIIHGYKASHEEYIYQGVKDRLLANTIDNVIMVNWSIGASPLEYFGIDYPIAVRNTGVTAKRTAKFINDNGLDLSKVYCVGHSLGAQTCGQLGKELEGKLSRITGLDPAGPFFPVRSQIRLSPGDADFVDVIHTDRVLGNRFSVGHADFYINFPTNSTKHQPLCGDFICDHGAAVALYANSTIPGNTFTSDYCSNTTYNQLGHVMGCAKFDEKKTSYCGYYATKNVEYGNYFVKTDEKYAQP